MYWNLFNTKINVQSRSVTTTSTGNEYTYTNTYTNVPALVEPTGSSMSLNDDGRKVLVDYRIMVPQNIVVHPADVVAWNGLSLLIEYVRNYDSKNLIWEIKATQFIDGC